MNMQWNSDQVQAYLKQIMGKRLEAAAIFLENSAKEEVSLAGTGGAAYAHKRSEFKGHWVTTHYKKGDTIYGFVRSKPGEPPRKQTGHLRRNITHEVDRDRLTARVGTNLEYGRYLEFGTQKMAARPWLRSTYARVLGELSKIMSSGKTGGAKSAPASWS